MRHRRARPHRYESGNVGSQVNKAKFVLTNIKNRAEGCGNTMTKQNLPKEQLVKGCGIANKGGVVRLMELQEQGYTYLRP